MNFPQLESASKCSRLSSGWDKRHVKLFNNSVFWFLYLKLQCPIMLLIPGTIYGPVSRSPGMVRSVTFLCRLANLEPALIDHLPGRPTAMYQTTRNVPTAAEATTIIPTIQSNCCSPCFYHSFPWKPQWRGFARTPPPPPPCFLPTALELLHPTPTFAPTECQGTPVPLSTVRHHCLFMGSHLLII